MKAPTYILKRVYLERNQERELRNHEKRLSQIISSKEHTINEVKRKTKLVQSQQDLIKKNHERAIQFRNFEKQREQIASDNVLMKKLIQMSISPSVQLQQSTIRTQPSNQPLQPLQNHGHQDQKNNQTTPLLYSASQPSLNKNTQGSSQPQFFSKDQSAQQNQESTLPKVQHQEQINQNSSQSNHTAGEKNDQKHDGSSVQNATNTTEQKGSSQQTQEDKWNTQQQNNYSQVEKSSPSPMLSQTQPGIGNHSDMMANQSGVISHQGKSSTQKLGFRQNQSSVGLHSVGRKREEERINMENLNLAHRMMKLPPVISNKKLETEYQKNKQLGQKIQRFHHLKKKVEKEYDRKEKKELDNDENADGLDGNDKALMDQKVQLVLCFKSIQFINYLPRNIESEKYYMEIKASIRAPRTTTPELYDDFAKATVNEFFYLHELRKSKLMYIGFYQSKDGKENFLGDFEIDLTPFYLEGVSKPVSMDLRNFKELNKRPAYMTTDMRKKGGIDFDLKVSSNIKEYLLDKQKVNRDDAPTMDESNKKDWTDIKSNPMN